MPLESLFMLHADILFSESLKCTLESAETFEAPRGWINPEMRAWDFHQTGSNEALVRFISRFIRVWRREAPSSRWIVSKTQCGQNSQLRINMRAAGGEGEFLPAIVTKKRVGFTDLAKRLRQALALADGFVVRTPLRGSVGSYGDAMTAFLELLDCSSVLLPQQVRLDDCITDSRIRFPLSDFVSLSVEPLSILVESKP